MDRVEWRRKWGTVVFVANFVTYLVMSSLPRALAPLDFTTTLLIYLLIPGTNTHGFDFRSSLIDLVVISAIRCVVISVVFFCRNSFSPVPVWAVIFLAIFSTIYLSFKSYAYSFGEFDPKGKALAMLGVAWAATWSEAVAYFTVITHIRRKRLGNDYNLLSTETGAGEVDGLSREDDHCECVQSFAREDSLFMSVLGLDIHYIDSKKPSNFTPHDGGAIVLLHGFGASAFVWDQVMPLLAKTSRVVATDAPGFGLSSRPNREQFSRLGPWTSLKRPSFGVHTASRAPPETPLTDVCTGFGNDIEKNGASLRATEGSVPNHPFSSGPLGAARPFDPYTVSGNVDLIMDMLGQLGVEGAVTIIGHSTGAAVALGLALRYPETVDSLILVAPTGIHSMDRVGTRFVRVLSRARLMRGMLRQLLEGHLAQWLERAWHNPDKMSKQQEAAYRAGLRMKGWDVGLTESIRTQPPTWLRHNLCEVKQPVLLVSGDDDRIVPLSDSVKLAAELPHAELVVIDECGHLPHEEKPMEFVDSVDRFLQRVRPTRHSINSISTTSPSTHPQPTPEAEIEITSILS
eukprot:Rmarinus@m.24796